MTVDFLAQQRAYADLIIQRGGNLYIKLDPRYFQFDNAVSIEEISISNQLGTVNARLIPENPNLYRADMTSLLQGFYILKIKDSAGNIHVGKLIVQ